MDWSAVIGAAVTSGLSFLLGRKTSKRKTSAEVKTAEAIATKTQLEATGQEIENMQEMLKLWQEMTMDLKHQNDDFKSQVAVFRQENTQLKNEMGIYREENNHLKIEMATFRQENIQLRDEMLVLHNQNGALKIDIKKLTDLLQSNELP